MIKRILFALSMLVGSVPAAVPVAAPIAVPAAVAVAVAVEVIAPAPALAVEHVGDTATLTLETGWTRINATTLAASNVWAKRAYKGDATILKGHTYTGTVTISGYSGSGSVFAYVTGVKMACASGTWLNSPNGLTGETTVPDNFTTNSALVSSVPDFPSTGGIDQREPDPNGSFRFSFNMGKSHFAPDDPMVCPGQPGASHLHMFMGNTGTNAYSTYHSLRTTGGTSSGDDRYPVNRTAYWMPAMLDGAGHAVVPCCELTYYKAIPMGIPECQGLPDATHIGICVELPNGLRWIGGYNFATGLHGPLDSSDTTSEAGQFTFACHGHGFRETADPNDTPVYHSIDAARTSGNPNCAVGPQNYLYVALGGPICWDGVHLDSPDHRSHVAYNSTSLTESSTVTDPSSPLTDKRISVPGAGVGKCPTTHPYVLPSLSLQMGFKIDANFVAGHWHLSSDEQMGSAMAAGATLHLDYFEAWSRPIKDRWTGNASAFTGCDNGRHNGNNGMLCDGYKIVGGNGGGSGDYTASQLVTPRNRVGWSRPMVANGTYTFELKAVSDGELGLYGVGGFSATGVTFTINDVTNVGKATGVVVHN